MRTTAELVGGFLILVAVCGVIALLNSTAGLVLAGCAVGGFLLYRWSAS